MRLFFIRKGSTYINCTPGDASSDEFLTATQIAGFFSRLASKKTLENDDQEGVEVAAHEACLESIVNEAASEIAPKHPIVYDAYNLCEMVSQKKLNEFSITVLKDINLHFPWY